MAKALRRVLVLALTWNGASFADEAVTDQTPARAAAPGAEQQPMPGQVPPAGSASAPAPAAPSAIPAPSAAVPSVAPNAAPPPAPPEPDRSALPAVKTAEPAKPKLPWHDTWLILENQVTAQTLGIGRSFQSSNPTYDVALSLRPRFYFYDTDVESIFLTGRIDVTREFTNNDVTTEQGETIVGGAPHGLGAADPTLSAIYRRVLAKRGDYETTFYGWLPELTFPASKFSWDNGTYLGVAAEARIYQDVPLAGSRASAFQMMTMGAIIAYNHTFTRATTPTNLQLFRVRLDPEGKTVPGDQLIGAAFPEHELRGGLRFIVEVAKHLTWWTDLFYQPAWLYSFSNVPLQIQSGTVSPTPNPNPNTYIVVTQVDTSLTWDVMPELSLSIGYDNTETQPGLDGQRRNIFTSPGAAFYLELIGRLDQMYLTATGRRSSEVTYKRR